MGEYHIVIAEDDIDDGEIVIDSFDRHPLFRKVHWVKNGKELIDFLHESNPKPDVILTDINMPIMSGIDALEEICEHSALKDIPAFVYSSTLNPVYEAKCMDLCVKGFIIKPLSLKEFDQIPDKIINILKTDF